MSEVKAIIEMLDHNYIDTRNAFRGLEEKYLHVRPIPRTLAISEIAAHIAYCEAQAVFGRLFGLPRKSWSVTSPFFYSKYSYPPNMYTTPIRQELLEMGVAEVRDELFRIHQLVMAKLHDFEGTPEERLKGAWGRGKNVRNHLSYLVFHVAYHTGQLFLTRQFLREKGRDE
ncbi:DinB family protein [Candidatus Acetothermia bacterium]|nr:DinB family protein [Candidatus Acetothermia bacterium]